MIAGKFQTASVLKAKVADKVANTAENQKLKYLSNRYNNVETTTEFFKAFATFLDLGIDLKKLFMRVKLCASTYLAV